MAVREEWGGVAKRGWVEDVINGKLGEDGERRGVSGPFVLALP